MVDSCIPQHRSQSAASIGTSPSSRSRLAWRWVTLVVALKLTCCYSLAQGHRFREISADISSSSLVSSPLSTICPGPAPTLDALSGGDGAQILVASGKLLTSTLGVNTASPCLALESRNKASLCGVFARHPAAQCAGAFQFAGVHPGDTVPELSTATSSRVFLLQNVFVSPQGHVFNETHFLYSPETATNEFMLPQGTRAAEYDKVVFILPQETAYTTFSTAQGNWNPIEHGKGMEDAAARAGRAGHHRRPTYRHLMEGLIPAVSALYPLLKALKTWPMLLPHSPAVRGISTALLGVDISWKVVFAAGDQVPAALDEEDSQKAHPIFVRNLIVPELPRCARPSKDSSLARCQALWHPMRAQHLVPPRGLPVLTNQWLPRDAGATPEQELSQKLPDSWVVVLALSPRDPQKDKEGSGTDRAVEQLVSRLVPMDRVVHFNPHAVMRDVKELFRRAVMVVGSRSLGLSNLVFMPFGSAVVELCAPHRCSDDISASSTPETPLPISFRHLAKSCELQWHGVMCNSEVNPSSVEHQRYTVNCSEKMEELEGVLRRVLSAFNVTGIAGADDVTPATLPAVPVLVPVLSAGSTRAGPDDEDPNVQSLLNKVSTRGSLDELTPQLWDAAYNKREGVNRTHTVLFKLKIPSVEEALPDLQGDIRGARDLSKAGMAKFLSWQECVAREGRWEYNATPRSLPWEYTGWHNTCDVRHEAEGGIVTARADEAAAKGVTSEEWKVRETLKYEWKVPRGKCVGPRGGDSWHKMDGRELCRLGKRYRASTGKDTQGGLHIFVVGDSMQEQFAQMFMNMLLWHVKKPALWAVNKTACYDWVPHQPHEHCKVYRVVDLPEVCPGGLTLHFVSNRWLTIGDNFVAKESVPWFESRGLVDADVVVLNRGAHYTEDSLYERDVKRALNFVRKNFPDKLLVYRTTPAGHANCTYADRPIEKPDDPSALPYNWGDFLHQNGIAKPMVQAVGGIVLDVIPFMQLRADGHRSWREFDNLNLDCLHYCSPGPPDVWTEYLFNMLRWLLPD